MSKKGSIVKAGFGYTVGNYILKGIVFITTPIFARMMSTGDYGRYNAFVSYESMLFVIIGLAIHSSYKNAYYKFRESDSPEDERGYQKYIAITMYFLFGGLFFWMIIALLLNGTISELLGIDHVAVYLLVIGSFLTAISNCYSADKGIHYQYRGILVISILNTLLSVAFSIILMKTVFSEQMYMGRIIGGLIPGICIYLTIAILYIRKASVKGMGPALAWGIKYSLPIVPHGMSQIILSQFDRIMILRMIGDSQSGIYSFAYTIYSMLAVTSSSIDGVWSPWFYEKRKQNDYQSIKNGSGLYILIMFIASIGVVLLSPEIIMVLGGVKYQESVYCAIPIVIGGFFACIYNVPCLVEYYHEKTKWIALSTASAAIVNIILNALFIQRFGYVAAAYTTLFTYFLYFFAHFFTAKKIEGKNLFPIGLIVFCILVLAICAVVSLIFLHSIFARLLFFLIILGITVFYEEKRYSCIKNRIIPKLKKYINGKEKQ